MTEPEFLVFTEPPPEYVDLAQALVGLREALYMCGQTPGDYPPAWVSEDDFSVQKMEARIRQALAAGKLLAYFQEGSELIELTQSIWEDDSAWEAIRIGTPLKITTETSEALVRPLVETAAIFSVDFTDMGQPTAPSSEAMKPGQDDGFLPPYLAFMLRSAKDLRLDGRRVLKSTIRDYLEANWPPELGPWSEVKLTKMATLLGHPNHEKGGLFPAKDRGPTAKG